jgi:hypothetical protein
MKTAHRQRGSEQGGFERNDTKEGVHPREEQNTPKP